MVLPQQYVCYNLLIFLTEFGSCEEKIVFQVALLTQSIYSHADHHYKPLESVPADRSVPPDPRSALVARREPNLVLWSDTQVEKVVMVFLPR